MENSSFQSASESGLRNNGIGRLPDMVENVERDRSSVARNHHVHLGRDTLFAEIENVNGLFAPPCDLFGAHVSERLAGTDRGTHGPLADGSPVVTHIALHHLLALGKDFRNPERASEHAVRTADAARLQG